jgi:hypothetical protein
LGTLPVVGLRDTAVLVVRVSSSIFGPVATPELFSVVVIFSGSGDISVTEADGWWGSGGDSADYILTFVLSFTDNLSVSIT